MDSSEGLVPVTRDQGRGFSSETLDFLDSVRVEDSSTLDPLYQVLNSTKDKISSFLEGHDVQNELGSFDERSLIVVEASSINDIENEEERIYLSGITSMSYLDREDGKKKVVLIMRDYWDLTHRDSEEDFVSPEYKSEYNNWWESRHLVMSIVDTVCNQDLSPEFTRGGVEFLSFLVLMNHYLGNVRYPLFHLETNQTFVDAFELCYRVLGDKVIKVLCGDESDEGIVEEVTLNFQKHLQKRVLKGKIF